QPDALCFTAGLPAALFGAGVIHAYLAAERPAPKVAAGVSLGALTAAVLQRCYKDLNEATTHGLGEKALESARCRFSRRYLAKLTDSPLGIVWRSFPDPIDFFADLPPVEDLACPSQLKPKEKQARRNYFLLTNLGRWVARLPIGISRLV